MPGDGAVQDAGGWGFGFRDAEVEDLQDETVLLFIHAQKQVLRLQVAVDDPVIMSRAEALRDLYRDGDCPLRLDRPARKRVAQGLPFQQFGDSYNFV